MANPNDPREQAAPDTARSYERAQPDKEGGMGRLDNNQGTPVRAPDRMEHAVTHKQPQRQLNADDVVNAREEAKAAPEQPDHSMKEEEPLGWDQAPQESKKPDEKRHPRVEGKGGTP